MQVAPNLRLSIGVLLILLFAGCSQMAERPAPPASVDPDIQRAADMLASGQYAAASQLYRELAARTPDAGRRAAYLLDAGEAATKSGDRDGARAVLAQLQVMVLGENDSLRRRLLQAEVLLQEKNATAALQALGDAPGATIETALQVRYFRDLAATYRQMGNLLESANALQAVDALLTDRQQRLATQTEILRTLALLNELVLTRLQPSPPGTPGGWMELALLVKKHGTDPAVLRPLMAQWRERFPRHPALPELLDNYQAYLQQQLQQVSRIAVLLPHTGRFSQVAASIRDGLLISRYRLPAAKRPTLRFYDTSDPAGIWPLYNQAIADGAELVIGPLQKEAVTQMLRAGDLAIPVLALNQVELETTPPPNLFMYSLSPEDEARQAAEKIWLDGGRRPVVLAPQGEWGDRVAGAFEQRWGSLGGEIAGVGRYDAQTHDYTATITSVLHLDESEARHREIQKWLARNVEFEPRRRADTDAVFIVARPIQAQGLRPQLQFHRAGDLPIYATSHAWNGQLSPDQVQDMKGIMLADIPWLLANGTGDSDTRNEIALHLPASTSAYARLYAMGMDALRLVPHLKRLNSSRYESLDGSTGNLYMDETNQVHRQLVWLVLDEQPRILGFAPRLDLQRDTDLSLDTPPESAETAPAS